MTKQQRKIIEREFCRYKWNKTQAENYAVRAVAYDSKTPDGERVKTSGDNANEQIIIRAIFDQERMLGWCKVFEYTLIKFKGEDKDKLMQKRYLENKSIGSVCYELHIAESTYHYWHNLILLTAFNWAKEFKLF